jgi:hypothetical protein
MVAWVALAVALFDLLVLVLLAVVVMVAAKKMRPLLVMLGMFAPSPLPPITSSPPIQYGEVKIGADKVLDADGNDLQVTTVQSKSLP